MEKSSVVVAIPKVFSTYGRCNHSLVPHPTALQALFVSVFQMRFPCQKIAKIGGRNNSILRKDVANGMRGVVVDGVLEVLEYTGLGGLPYIQMRLRESRRVIISIHSHLVSNPSSWWPNDAYFTP